MKRVNITKIHEKWQEQWEKFSCVEPDERKKFFIIFAYPGISGFLHVGHMRGYTYADVIARFKRLTGHNVLFPVGTHASGNQVISFYRKIQEKDKRWVEYLKANGCSDELVQTLVSPKRIIEFFNDVYVNQYWKKFGFICDWKRFTSTAFPDYQKFIQWQFKKLKKLGLLIQKPYYVTYCPRCGPVAVDPSETDISKGGKAEKIEFVVLKFKFENIYLVAATLRPETVFGQTNIWVNPNVEYVKARVGSEIWILSKESAKKLKSQKDEVEVIGHISGKELIGKTVIAPMIRKEIPILPASFCDPKFGTGIVTSVPSDAPYDWVALKDLQTDEAKCKAYGLDPEMVKRIKVVQIINIPGVGDFAAKIFSEKFGIKNQTEIEKLENATKEVYKLGFHSGTMKETCGKYAGMRVYDAKELVKKELMESGNAEIMYDLSEEVICRCGERVIIKKVKDQWFINYGSQELKTKTKAHVKNMRILPTEFFNSLPKIIDWYQERACTRLGNWIGTKLPFDEKWIIEPISDSTLYPIYYLISKYVNEGKLKEENLTEEFFDFVFLGDGNVETVSKTTGISKELLEKIRNEIEYWYPLDINLGGKEHQTVHFPVFVMNHVAILPEKFWPKGIFVHWWVVGKGTKISKSKGGAVPIPDLIAKYSVDGLRLYYCHIGNPHSDIVWNDQDALNYKNHLERVFELVTSVQDKESREIDYWLKNRMEKHIKEARDAFEYLDFRKAAEIVYFCIYEDLKWYIRRGGGNKELITALAKKWALLMNPITPHLSEELWKQFGGKALASFSKWPEHEEYDDSKFKKEELIKNLLSDIVQVIKLCKKQPEKIIIILPEAWKYEAIKYINKIIIEKKPEHEILKDLMDKYPRVKECPKVFMSVIRNRKFIPLVKNEKELLEDAKEMIEKEFSCKVEIKGFDPVIEKAKQSIPGRPAILVV